MPSKRSELANILRRLADYIDRHPDEDLAPILAQAAALTQSVTPKKKQGPQKKTEPIDVRALAGELVVLSSREAGDSLLREKAPNRTDLETVARFLQLPVQRDDTVEKLRAKIVENTIGSRLRSNAIQGNSG